MTSKALRRTAARKDFPQHVAITHVKVACWLCSGSGSRQWAFCEAASVQGIVYHLPHRWSSQEGKRAVIAPRQYPKLWKTSTEADKSSHIPNKLEPKTNSTRHYSFILLCLLYETVINYWMQEVSLNVEYTYILVSPQSQRHVERSIRSDEGAKVPNTLI